MKARALSSTRPFWGACALALLVAAGCEKGIEKTAPAELANEPANGLKPSTDLWVHRRTTSPHIALGNLDSQIATRFEAFEKGTSTLNVRSSLVQLLLQRTKFTGSFGDFERTDAVTRSVVQDFGNNPRADQLRASHLSATHQFDAALLSLGRAEKLGGKGVPAARGWIHIAQGRELLPTLALAKRLASAKPTPQAFALWAAAEAALGRFSEADQHYQAALDANVDVSPFLVCQILFQRGVMWAEKANQSERAIPLYQEALRRLPRFVSANVHLAELQAEAGDVEGAIARLHGLSAKTADPEPKGVLAELLEKVGRSGSVLKEEAKSRYESLLQRHREGFLDHASEFFAGAGEDPKRALKLAQENLKLREGARARMLVINAAHAADDAAAGCSMSDASRQWADRSPSLAAVLAEHAEACSTLPKR